MQPIYHMLGVGIVIGVGLGLTLSGRRRVSALARGAFIPCAIVWDPVSGLFEHLHGPDEFSTREEAEPCR
jgi:hypothetical protein